jgi:GNAT superfamily N-acetyltransferase
MRERWREDDPPREFRAMLTSNEGGRVPTVAMCACEFAVEADSDAAFPRAYLAHVRETHSDWPYPDLAVEIVGEALLRLTGPKDRVEQLGDDVTVSPVMPDHLDAWLSFFDHDAFVDRPWIAACYCLEQHGPMARPAIGSWRENRAAMDALFRAGKAYGYLAFVGGRPAGWVNAALRRDQVYALDRPDDATTITVSCFNVAVPYRGHGLQARLLDRVIADAPGRRAARIEAYPHGEPLAGDVEGAFRGALSLYESRGFTVIKDLGARRVVRLTL